MAQLVIGIGAWLLLIPTALVLRPALAVSAAKSEGAAEVGMPVSRALRSRSFIVLGVTYFTCCAAHSGPIFHTVSYAIGCGLPTMAAVTIYSMEGVAGLGGACCLACLATASARSLSSSPA